MPDYHIDILLIDDGPQIRSFLQSSIDEVAKSRRDEVTIHVRQVESLEAAFDLIHKSVPNILIISITESSQSDLVPMVRILRQIIMTKHKKVIILTDLIDPVDAAVLNDNLKVAPIMFFPFRLDIAEELISELKEREEVPVFRARLREGMEEIFMPYLLASIQSNIRAAIASILTELKDYTGLHGPSAADETLADLRKERLEGTRLYEVLFFDWRKIGLAANDRFGRPFGDFLIKKLGNTLKEEIASFLAKYFEIEAEAYHYGKGDEYIVVFGSDTYIGQQRLSNLAKTFAHVVREKMRSQIEKIYHTQRKVQNDPTYRYNFLVGPRVKDKAGRYAIVLLPDVRVVQISGYREIIDHAGLEAIKLNAEFSLKQADNSPELAMNALLGMPADTYPEESERFTQQLEEIQRISKTLGQPYLKVKLLTARQVLKKGQ